MLKNVPLRCTVAGSSAALGGRVWTADWLRRNEPAAAASLNMSLADLMIRAGSAAYRALVDLYGADSKHWVILAGPGNNGGDGYVVARLAHADKRRVTVMAMPTSKALPPEATNALQQWRALGGHVEEITESTTLPPDADVIVDGLLGTGIAGAPRGLYASVIARANELPARRFAIDIPSGLNAETGATPGACFRADHTITFISLKPGLLTGQARSVVGGLTYDTLGLDAWLAEETHTAATHCRRLGAGSLASYFGEPRLPTAHKGTNGRVLLVGGAAGYGGAILMAAEACLASGAGLTRVLTDAAHVAPLLTRCPEAMYAAVDTTGGGPAQVEEAASLMEWADVVAVGPGLGRGPFAHSTVTAALRCALAAPRKTVVLDADALNVLPEVLPAALGGAGAPALSNTIITPHPGEAATLLGCTVAEVEADRFEAARRLAAVLGGTCILKGPGSVVCEHRGAGEPCTYDSCAIVDAGNAGMATGGMGDVLTGVLASAAAQKVAQGRIFDVACAGALAHAVAADLVVQPRGTRGLRATELIDRLPYCFNATTASFL